MTTSRSQRAPLTRADWLVPASLLLLSFVPLVGGVARLMAVADGVATAENARFLQAPLPIVIHVSSATLYAWLGAFQFSRGLRLRFPRWHRHVGRVVVACGILTGLTGLWMTLFYPIPTPHQGPLLVVVRVLVGAGMLVTLMLGVASILRRDIARHEAFMIRAYALAQGAGTQVLVLGPWMILTGESEGLTRDVLMALSWGINVVVAEWIIAGRQGFRPSVAASS